MRRALIPWVDHGAIDDVVELSFDETFADNMALKFTAGCLCNVLGVHGDNDGQFNTKLGHHMLEGFLIS